MKKYDSSNIKILKGLDAVKKRPGMYIGNTDDGSGLHKMVFEVIDNSIDEAVSGYCDFIDVCINDDGSATVIDNGRGIPVDIYKDEGKSAAEVVMTTLHSGGKFDDKSYKTSGGLHGVGISVVNALSNKLFLKIFKNGYIYEQNFTEGNPDFDLRVIGKTDKSGTEIKFYPNGNIFSNLEFNYDFIFKRLKELSYLNPNIKIKLSDKRKNSIKEILLNNKGGLVEFIKYLNSGKSLIVKDPIYFSGLSNEIYVEIVIQWIDSYKDNILCYTNNIYQQDGGTHLIGFKNSIIKVIKSYIENEFYKKNKLKIIGDDSREGITAILVLKMNDPKFSSQTKDKLVSLEAKSAVESIINSKFKDFLYENPSISKLICNKVLNSARIREASRKARELSRKKNSLDISNFYGKLSDCRETNPSLSELFIVEGDSAGGSAKQARDRKTQAILPIKGKILNVEKAGFDKLLSNSEIRSLISSLGCGIGDNDYDINKLRYHKIIFMTDADIDGSHIKTLLLTFFYRHMPKIIEDGYIYIAQPPLYALKKGNTVKYIKDEFLYKNFILDSAFSKMSEYFVNIDSNKLCFLEKILSLYKNVIHIIDNILNKFPRNFLLGLVYYSNNIVYSDKIKTMKLLEEFELFLNRDNSLKEKFYLEHICLSNDNYINIKHLSYGLIKEFEFDFRFFNSKEYNIFRDLYHYISKFFSNDSFLIFNGKTYYIYDFNNLIDTFIEIVKKEYKVQRYKGLGEMNPDQLWETTMNPKTRTLNRVIMNDFKNTGLIVESLMGDKVIDRKNFIEKYSISLINIDI